MRKFVVKNRRKRKYVRKSQKTSSYSFSKTFYGTLPILIMAIAFMATIIISPSFRSTFSNFKFTIQPIHLPSLQFPSLELPKFSLGNPILFFQELAFDIYQIWIGTISIFTTIWISLTHFFSALGDIKNHSVIVFDIQPLLGSIESNSFSIGSSFIYFSSLVVQGVLNTYAGFTQISLLTNSIATIGISRAITFIIHSFTLEFPFVMTYVAGLIEIIIKSIIFAAQSVAAVTGTVFVTLFKIVLFVVQAIFSVMTAVWAWITSVVRTIVHIIEIPFTILGNFGLKIKPYIDFLSRHIAMTGGDFNRAFSSLGKAASYMSSSK